MRFVKLATITLLAFTVASCQRAPDTESLRLEILELHRDFIQAHLDKEARFIAEPTSPDYLFMANGLVERMNASQMEEMLAEYLHSNEFSEYRAVADPIIGFSDDGSLAWAIVQVRVAGTQSDPSGPSKEFDTLWAWISLYHRSGERWLHLTDVSTSRPVNNTE
ncbi:MAG: hypothetical protein GY835_24425 [bacterium]|nr:hypothetical protein [bacterium]